MYSTPLSTILCIVNDESKGTETLPGVQSEDFNLFT